MVGLEIDSDHRPELEIDEEQKDVVDRGVTLLSHREEGYRRGPCDGATDSEQRKIVKRVDQQLADHVGESVDPLIHSLGLLQLHSSLPFLKPIILWQSRN